MSIEIMKSESIKELIENENYVVIPDTNILLNIYKYSPAFTEFSMDCIKAIQKSVVIPGTVRLEYGKHCRSDFAKMKSRVLNDRNELDKQIKLMGDKIVDSCNNLERYNYPDVEQLKDDLSECIGRAREKVKVYFENRAALEFNSSLWQEDHLMEFVQSVENDKRVLPYPTMNDIYLWCEEGEKRYSKSIPPGYKDKGKGGLREYCDLIIWKEILGYAKEEKKNVIFITDDVKEDWWERNGKDINFHSKLTKEFAKTGQQIVGMTSGDFYREVSDAYGIDRIDEIELALNMTDDQYAMKVQEKVLEQVCTKLCYDSMEFINEETSHIGSEGVDEFTIEKSEYRGYERVDSSDTEAIYQFTYFVELSGTSYEYWGRDDDTKEVITSYGTDHTFEGEITVEIYRETDLLLDFQETEFELARIVRGDLKETEYHDRCEDDYIADAIGICPDCGKPFTIETDGGNGFCVDCAPNH